MKGKNSATFLTVKGHFTVTWYYAPGAKRKEEVIWH